MSIDLQELLRLNLRWRRRNLHISHEDLAARLAALGWPEVDRGKISLIERGKRKIEVVEFFKLAYALDIAPVELLTHVHRSLVPERRVRVGLRIRLGSGVEFAQQELRDWLTGTLAQPSGKDAESAGRREAFYGSAGAHPPGWFRPEVLVEMEDALASLRQKHFDGDGRELRSAGDTLKAAVDRAVELMLLYQKQAAAGAFEGEI